MTRIPLRISPNRYPTGAAFSRRLKRLAGLLLLLFLTGCLPWPESPPQVKQVALADLDGDGALDAVLANGRFGEPYSYPPEIQYQILYNDGQGNFTRHGVLPRQWNHHSVAVGDVNGDLAPDAVFGPGPMVALNDGAGGLTRLGSAPHSVTTSGFVGGLALADLNGDGRQDIFVANCCGGDIYTGAATTPGLWLPHNLVFFNDGAGHFTDSGQRLGQWGSNAVALGDLNGDGTPDAFVANGQSQLSAGGRLVTNTPDTVWFNRGDGFFTDSGQQLGASESTAVALGDVNGDGFLDAAVGSTGPDAIWLNDGRGFFTLLDELDNGLTRDLFLVDLDGDGILDLFTAGETTGRVWRNDGHGRFTEVPTGITYHAHDAVAIGDVNGDGLPDVFVGGINEYRVWRNEGDGRFRLADDGE
jgi:hypothetical protein